MRILMITSDFYDTGHGGVEGHILGLTRALQSQGHEVVIVRTARREQIRDYNPLEDAVDYRVLPSALSSSRIWARRLGSGGRVGLLLEFLRRLVDGVRSRSQADELLEFVGSVDVVHQHNFLESVGLTKRLAGRGLPVVWTNHLGEFLYLQKLRFVGRMILRRLTKHYRVTFAPSSELADRSAIAASVHMIPNGVDTDRFRGLIDENEKAQTRSILGWPTDRPVIIVPRRWAPTKGVVYAAQAMLHEAWPEKSHVVFAGSGTAEYPGYRREIEQFLSQARCSFEVHASVDQGQMASMLRAADVCLVPSVKEATSLSALEAMASRTLVVAANVGGLPEILRHGSTGFLHEPESPASIATTLNEALTHLDSEIRDKANDFVRTSYSWEAVASSTLAHYPKVETT